MNVHLIPASPGKHRNYGYPSMNAQEMIYVWIWIRESEACVSSLSLTWILTVHQILIFTWEQIKKIKHHRKKRLQYCRGNTEKNKELKRREKKLIKRRITLPTEKQSWFTGTTSCLVEKRQRNREQLSTDEINTNICSAILYELERKR